MDILRWLIRLTFVHLPRGLFWAFATLFRTLLRSNRPTFGSARWARASEIRQARAFKDEGLIVGRVGRKLLRFNGDGVTLLFAKMRAGKGVGVVIPNLLEYGGSVICTDIKGENTAITRRHRQTFGPVFTLDLQDPDISNGWNPLDRGGSGNLNG